MEEDITAPFNLPTCFLNLVTGQRSHCHVWGTFEWEALAVLLKCTPGCCRIPAWKDPTWRVSCSEVSCQPFSGRNEGSEPSRGYSTPFIPTDACTPGETPLLSDRHNHLPPVPKPLRVTPALFTWFSRYSLVFCVQTTFGSSCCLHKNPSVFTCKPIFPSHTVLPRHKCTTHRAAPRLPSHTSVCWPRTFLTFQSKTLQAQLGLKRYHPSSILSQLPQEQAGIRLTWVHACVHLGDLTLLANFKDIKDNYFLPTSWQQAAGWQKMLDAAFHEVYLQQLLILLAPFSSQLQQPQCCQKSNGSERL